VSIGAGGNEDVIDRGLGLKTEGTNVRRAKSQSRVDRPVQHSRNGEGSPQRSLKRDPTRWRTAAARGQQLVRRLGMLLDGVVRLIVHWLFSSLSEVHTDFTPGDALIGIHPNLLSRIEVQRIIRSIVPLSTLRARVAYCPDPKGAK